MTTRNLKCTRGDNSRPQRSTKMTRVLALRIMLLCLLAGRTGVAGNDLGVLRNVSNLYSSWPTPHRSCFATTWLSCDQQGRVTGLALSGSNLSGPIPPQLGSLSNLKNLTLSGNHLSGSIPPELGKLSSLKYLSLAANNLSGSIPPQLGNLSSLATLFLYDNQLSGSIPPELGNLSNLTLLVLKNNKLSGPIPPELGSLSSLTYIALSGNNLSGSIPPQLGNLSSLTSLFLYDNQLSGSIPPQLGNLSNLTTLVLKYNHLSGSIPQELGHLLNLQFVQLAYNNLSGPIPPELSKLASLQTLALSYNQISGTIPQELGSLSNLTLLGLDNNVLEGSIPPQLSNLSNLQQLWVSHTQLSGHIPPELGNLSSLQELESNNNALSGSIPPELGNLSNLTVLDLSFNNLSGPIPPELGNLLNLQSVDLSNNMLSGYIPPQLADLRMLSYNPRSSIDYNYLIGTIPPGPTWTTLWTFNQNCLNVSAPTSNQRDPSSCYKFYNPQSPPPPFYYPQSPPPPSHHRGSRVGVFVGVALGILSFIVAVIGFLVWRSAKGGRDTTLLLVRGEVEANHLRYFTAEDINAATDCFAESNLLGTGGFGSVYKGVLSDGTEIAVKKILAARPRISGDSTKYREDFIREMNSIGNVRHKNLVRLRGICVQGEQRLLVFDFIPNGSLEQALKNFETAEKILTWEIRRNIALGVADALYYLHHQASVHGVVHLDVKPANVLLTSEWMPLLADFGLAKELGVAGGTEQAGGTRGYMGPEVFLGWPLSKHSDVYSFGMNLLVLLTREAPFSTALSALDPDCPPGLLMGVRFFYERGRLLEVVDRAMGLSNISLGAETSGDASAPTAKAEGQLTQVTVDLKDTNSHVKETQQLVEIERFLHVALLCTLLDPESRPTMEEVKQMLEGKKEVAPPSVELLNGTYSSQPPKSGGSQRTNFYFRSNTSSNSGRMWSGSRGRSTGGGPAPERGSAGESLHRNAEG